MQPVQNIFGAIESFEIFIFLSYISLGTVSPITSTIECQEPAGQTYQCTLILSTGSEFIGEVKNGVLQFKDIPYAQPPVGERRWKAPEVLNDFSSFSQPGIGKLSPRYQKISMTIRKEILEVLFHFLQI